MAAEKKCCVPGCGLDSEILHKFPNPNKDIDRFRTWIYNVGGDILGKDDQYIFKYRRICHLHFEKKYHTRSKFLSANAVPTLNLGRYSFVTKPTSTAVEIQSINIPPTKPSTSGLPCAKRPCLVDITKQALNTPATPSTSGNASTSGLLCDKQSDLTDIALNILNTPATPSTSGNASKGQINERQDKPKGVEKDKTLLSLKSSTTKKRFGKEQNLLKEVNKLMRENLTYKQKLNKARKLKTNPSFLKTMKKFTTLAGIFMMIYKRRKNNVSVNVQTWTSIV